MVTFPPRELRFGHAGHWGLYLLMLASAFSGWALAGTFKRPLDSFFALLVVVHIASAFYHLWWRKDDVMQRMLR